MEKIFSYSNYPIKSFKVKKKLIMGILNITPDSFYSNSRSYNDEKIKLEIRRLINFGSDIIDIGGYSSRPNASFVSEEEEIKRLTKGLSALRKINSSIPVSIDTFRSGVVKYIYENYGKIIVNDISGGKFDKNMFNIVSKLDLPYIAMHMKGTPSTMQNKINTTYKQNNVVKEVLNYFEDKLKIMKENYGINKIIIDPGFGFSKTLQQNYQLLDQIQKFKTFEFPLLVGISRKSMLYKLLGNKPSDCLNATSIINTISLMKGADILRVHDPKEAQEAIKIVSFLEENKLKI